MAENEQMITIPNSDNIGNGDAPCVVCGRHIWNVPLLLDTKESDGNGGWWWQVAGDQVCADCGEPLRWYHKSDPVMVDMSTVMGEVVDARSTDTTKRWDGSKVDDRSDQ